MTSVHPAGRRRAARRWRATPATRHRANNRRRRPWRGGNHVEIVTGAILRTGLTRDQLAAALNLEATPFSALVALPVDKTSDYVFDKLFPDLADDGGQAQVDSAPGNWFAYWRVRDAATQTDIRAH